jgi:glyoxylate/hydroxypyruvate reductase A
MISIALLSRPGLMDPVKEPLARELPGATFASWPEVAAEDAELAVCWKPEAACWRRCRSCD